MPGSYGSVRCEHGCGLNFFGRFLELLPTQHALANTLENHERRVTFVRMKDRWLKTKGPENANASDSQNDLLPYAVILVPAIETRRELPVRRRILVDLGIHQVESQSRKTDLPHFNKDVKRPHLKFHDHS